MKRIISASLVAALLAFAPAAQAANSTVSALTAASALGGTELLYVVQGAADRKGTPAQLATYVVGLITGDCTINTGTNVITCTKTNGANFGALATVTPGTGVATALAIAVGSAGGPVVNGGALGTPSAGSAANLTGYPAANLTGLGTGIASWLATPSSANLLAAMTTKTGTGLNVFGTAPTIDSLNATTALTLAFLTGSTQCLQVSTTGVVSGTGAVCGGAGSTGANPTAAAGPTANNGVATTFMRSDASPAIQLGTAAQKGIVQADGTTITVTAGVISAVGGGSGITSLIPGAGQVSSTTAACSQTTISAGGQTLSSAECLNAQVGTTYAIADGDRAKLVTGTNAAAQAYTIAQAGASTTFQSGWFADVLNKGIGPLTITPTTSTINGAASYVLLAGQGIRIYSDGANYQVTPWGSGGVTASSQTGVNYAFVSSNFGQLINLSNASNQIPTLPQAGSAGFPAGWYVQVCNQGAGTQTITPTTSTIGGAATYVLPAGSAAAPQCAAIVSDGANYQVAPDFFRFGTSVAAAAGTTLSAAGGLTSTIASGTAALGTTAIASGACATAVTATATGVATTDIVQASFNGDPTAVTGYTPVTTGMLTILPYPTANNVNFKVCNSTSASITPGAITLNYRVVR
jgi:hypothetical protein